MSISLFNIEASLQLLAETREAALTEGDTAAVEQCDKALAEYLTAEASKVESYSALIRRTTYEAECCSKEEARIAARRKQLLAFSERLEANALAAMQAFDVKELKSPTAKLRRQANGGITPLEITDPGQVPNEFLFFNPPPLTHKEFGLLLRALEYDHRAGTGELLTELSGRTRSVARTDEIRKALAEKVVCPECNGLPGNAVHHTDEESGCSDDLKTCPRCMDKLISHLKTCPRCEGTGTVQRDVPGAKLLPRGEHLRVS